MKIKSNPVIDFDYSNEQHGRQVDKSIVELILKVAKRKKMKVREYCCKVANLLSDEHFRTGTLEKLEICGLISWDTEVFLEDLITTCVHVRENLINTKTWTYTIFK